MEAVGGGASRDGGASLGRLLLAGLVAGLLAALANAGVYLLASAVGVDWSEAVVPGRGQITLGAVVSSSFVPALLGAAVYALIGRFTRRPARNFRVLAAVVLVLSLVTPFSVPGAPAAVILTLIFMHVVAAVVITGVLTAPGWRRGTVR